MSRETQFQNFSKLLWDEIMEMTLNGYGKIDFGTDPKGYEQLIARRAYDLVEHAFNSTDSDDCSGMTFRALIELGKIPDMTELPKGQEEYDNGEIHKALEDLIHSDKWVDAFNERGITSIHFPKEQNEAK
jgi:hypothetical protein